MTALVSTGQSYDFSNGQEAIVGITPNKSGKIDVTFNISSANVPVGGTAQISHTASYTGDITYSSDNTDIATVDANGVVTGKALGDATITATAAGNDDFNSKTQTFTVTVMQYKLQLKEAPYFNNSNNPYPDDNKLYLNLQNSTSSSVTESLYIVIKSATKTLGYGGKNITIQAESEYPFSISYNGLERYLAADEAATLYLYRDADHNYPYNIASIDFTYRSKLGISYTMSADGWGTICLPYSASIPSGLTAYSVDAVNGNVLSLTEAESLDMNTPYILNGTAGAYSFSGPNTPTGTYTVGKLQGTTATGQKAPKDSYVLQKHDDALAFYKVENANSQVFTQYRACVYDPDNNLTAVLLPGDDVTGINEVNHQPTTVNHQPSYNLAGQRVSPDTKGIVIIGGKKVYNK